MKHEAYLFWRNLKKLWATQLLMVQKKAMVTSKLAPITSFGPLSQIFSIQFCKDFDELLSLYSPKFSIILQQVCSSSY